MQVREVLDEPGVGRPHDVADRRGVLETRDADHDVGPAKPLDLLADGRRQGGLRHEANRTTLSGVASRLMTHSGFGRPGR